MRASSFQSFWSISAASTWSAQSPIKPETAKVVGNSRKSGANQLEKHSREPIPGPKQPNSAMLRVGLGRKCERWDHDQARFRETVQQALALRPQACQCSRSPTGQLSTWAGTGDRCFPVGRQAKGAEPVGLGGLRHEKSFIFNHLEFPEKPLDLGRGKGGELRQ